MFANLFTPENLTIFFILTALETVLGFDNLLYISIEAKRVDKDKEAYVRRTGILLAIGLRIILLFVVLKLIDLFQEPFFHFDYSIVKGEISGHSLIVLVGGVFLIYTAMKEIVHMLTVNDLGHGAGGRAKRSLASAFFWILLMNIVFSFDTVLSAIALTKVFPVMAAAIIVSGALMVWMADAVANFLKKNRMYEVLGLFVLLLVGFMLMSEGGHLAELSFFGYPIEPMSKSTFYFVLVTLIVVEVTQGRYQKQINKIEKQSDIPDA
jgi:predicted tellurium resistance membrane protein TerC